MSIKRLLVLALFLFSVSLFIPKTSQAIDLKEMLTSESSIVVKIQEGFEYFFAFGVQKKVEVLEKQAEKRLIMAQSYAEEGNNERVQNLMQNYLQIKEKQNNLLGKTNGGEILDEVEERTIEQQKIMEEIKTKINEDGKQNIIQVQERVVNQVAQRIVDVNGKDGATEFFNKVEHVWAPGTGPGGESGVVIEGGTMQFTPGTSSGGSSGADIKTVEVKTGGDSDSGGGTTVEGSNPGQAPDTSSGGGGTTVVGE